MKDAIPSTEVERCWREAHEVWDVSTALSPPQAWDGGKGGHWNGGDEPLAYIDLETRQVVVNHGMLARMGATSSLTAVLAHEIGHHVRFPHTLTELATLILLERRLVPGLSQSLTNLFYDLLVNEHVGRTRAGELCAVYRGSNASHPGPVPPLFAFYLAIYEELWSLPPGDLLPAADGARMETQYPGFRSDARVFVQTFYALPSIHLQFVYFCCRALRYIPDPGKVTVRLPLGSDLPSPGVDDFDAAVSGNGEQGVDRALEEAEAHGWLDGAGVTAGAEADPLAAIGAITDHVPGTGAGELREALVSRHYRRLVDEHLIEIPGETPPPQTLLPTVLEDWEWGDSPRAIDWTASVLAHGPLAPVHPLRREHEPDEDPAPGADFPAVEIYLDTSGSMPNPAQSLNVMTLAAQILAASALRKRGRVRGVVYSSGKPRVSPWMYDEETARRFLLHYFGGGTDYPFDVLRASAKEHGDVVRVVVSDADFLWNVQQHKGALDTIRYAIDKSRVLVAFLAVGEAQARATLGPVMDRPRFRLAVVKSLDEFAAAATALARALLGP